MNAARETETEGEGGEGRLRGGRRGKGERGGRRRGNGNVRWEREEREEREREEGSVVWGPSLQWTRMYKK